MPTYDASKAECLVFTFKEGLLSAVAHDLKLRAERLEIVVDAARKRVSARFEAAALRVVSAMKDGAEARGTLSPKDVRDIEDNMAKDVLETRKHPEIRFESTSVTETPQGWDVAGTLTVKGRGWPIRFSARRDAGRAIVELTLHQPEYGIKPFSALLGTLKIKPDVKVRVSVPIE